MRSVNQVVRAAKQGLPKRVFFHKTGMTDAWRKHPIVAREENVKIDNMFPGLKTAIALFAVFVAVRPLLNQPAAVHTQIIQKPTARPSDSYEDPIGAALAPKPSHFGALAFFPPLPPPLPPPLAATAFRGREIGPCQRAFPRRCARPART